MGPLEKANNIEVAALPTPAPVSPLPSQEKAPELSIATEASRAQPTAGGSFSLSAVVKNLRTKPITLTGRGSTLFLPPEVAGSEAPSLCTYTATSPPRRERRVFLTIRPSQSQVATAMPLSGLWAHHPGIVATNAARGMIQSIVRKVKSEMEFVFFSPGDYKATVTLSYHADDPPDSFRTITQSAVVYVAAPQSVILLGAAVGGLLGYIISLLFFSKKQDAVTPSTQLWGEGFGSITVNVFKFLAGAVGSIVLSAIVTILLSRLSETQFLIRVSINDFWGAIAVGFVANLTGIKIVQTISGEAPAPNGATVA